ncbi:MAG: TrmJ/YjtD family RNA methyltransferase [Acidobacteria bacterium]|nr:TrmJ/YjtD family RNA methyltransferase [Acidobacteriota bacterium]
MPAAHSRLCVVLVSPRNPLNIGAAARAMSNFGFLDLRLVNPYAVAFRNAKSAMGAAPLLASAREFPTLAEAVADCTLVVGTMDARQRELHHALKPLEAGARFIRRRLMSSQVALLFGSEKFGLSNEDVSHCHWLMRIPTREEHSSMNLGQAVGICLYELARQTSKSASSTTQGKKTPQANAVETERVTASLIAALRTSGYLHAKSSVDAEEKVRRLVRRLDLTSEDAELCLGMLRQMLWKMRHRES